MAFRPMRRKNNTISDEEARELLRTARYGVLAVNGDDGYPLALPINFLFDPKEDKIFFHSAKAGQKVEALAACDKVCFTVTGPERYEEGDWAPYVKSVVVFGHCHRIAGPGQLEQRLRELARKYYPSEEEIEAEMGKSLAAVGFYQIDIEHLCGKQVQEK